MARLALPTVTLCAVASVNVRATVAALLACIRQIDFAACKLFTHEEIAGAHPEITMVPIEPLRSAAAYSEFVVHDLAGHLSTEHCLIVQWDGFVLDAACWDETFLGYDYIGAPWPQFGDGRDVGNGGFSLRSKRLLESCQAPQFHFHHPEDIAICRTNRSFLEDTGMKFADREIAERFSFERTRPSLPTFGFHGIFNMIPMLGAERFWEIYLELDDRSTALVDFGRLMGQLGSGRQSAQRRLHFAVDGIRGLFR